MTRDEIDAMVERNVRAWRQRDVEALLADRADACVVESPLHGTIEGREQLREIYEVWFTAFPDAFLESGEVLVDGDSVVQFWTVTGTHAGEFIGMPASGRRFQIGGVSFYTLKDGKILHERRLYDVTAFLVQMGALKAKPR